MDMSQLLHPGFVSGINSLEILHLLSSPHYHYPSVYGEEDPMQANMRQLFSIGLKTVTITFLTGMNTTNMYLFKVIPRNSQTLTAITLNNFGIYGLDLLEKEHEVIPHLRRVTLQKVDNKVESVHGLVTWLESEPPLTQLDIHFGFKASTKFLKYLERSFRTESLKTLSLSAIYLQTAREWSWLERCNKLKEFGIVQEHFSSLGNWEMKATGVSFLPWLPKGLKKLRLRGMKGFWKDQADLGGDDIAEVEIVALLSRFPGLTHLDLTGCRGAVTDVMVQSIIGQMRKLEMLKLSHGSCTDFAVTGKENGVSLKELKGREIIFLNLTVIRIKKL